MRRKARGGKEKYYCDVCNKNIFDYVPKKGESITFMGASLPVMEEVKHCEYVQNSGILNRGEWCKCCYDKLNK